MPHQPWVDREEWQAVYEELPPESMQQVRHFFKQLDADGNGHVSKEELRTATKEGTTADQFEELWSILDVDRSGTLSMSEVALLLYMKSLNTLSLACCDGCQKMMLFDEVLYTDRPSRVQFSAEVTKWERNGNQGPAPSGGFDLCKHCYETIPNSSPVLRGVPKGVLFEVVNTPSVDFRKWPFMADDWGHWTRCKVCCTSHNADATSYLRTDSHMRPHPEGGFVCEFCSTVMCRKCADVLNATSLAKPGLWILCNDLKCPNSKHNPKSYRSDSKKAYVYKPEGVVARAHEDHRSHCFTCHKNLILNRHPVFPAPVACAGQDSGAEGKGAGITAFNVLQVASALVGIGQFVGSM